MTIIRPINAAYRAIQDRATITMRSGKQLEGTNKAYYDKLVEISGPSVHKPSRVLKSFIKAYKHQNKKLKQLEEWKAPFRETSPLVADIKLFLKGIINTFKKGNKLT